VTLVEDRTDEAPAEPPPAPAPDEAAADAAPPVAAPTETGGQSIVRALVVLLAVAVVAVVLWKAFDQLVGPTWFHTRQQHLAADYTEQRPGLKTGQAAAVLQIPGIAANLMVVEGASPDELRGGPGHLDGTVLPSQKGNSVIEGHHARWGAPFGELDRLVPRTRIVAMDRKGLPIEYRVTVVKVVKRAQLRKYLASSDDYRITLVTQAGGAFSTDRLVVQAVAGTPSKRTDHDKVPPLDPPPSSPVPAVLAAMWASIAAVVLAVRLRRDHGTVVVVLVVAPLVVGAVLAALLAVDTTLPPLL
jgi:sortase A